MMVTRVDMLTYEQEARLPELLARWAERRIAVGTCTEPADWAAFEDGARRCYEYAGVPWPGRVVRVSSPLVMAFAAPIAGVLLRGMPAKRHVKSLIRNAVHRDVDAAMTPLVHYHLHETTTAAERAAVFDFAFENGLAWVVERAIDRVVCGYTYHPFEGSDDEIFAEVDDWVFPAVDEAVSAAVGYRVRAAVDLRYNIDKIRDDIGPYWVYDKFDGQWGALDPAGAWLFRDECGLELGGDLWDRARAFSDAQSAAGWWFPHHAFVMVCDRPSESQSATRRRAPATPGRRADGPLARRVEPALLAWCPGARGPDGRRAVGRRPDSAHPEPEVPALRDRTHRLAPVRRRDRAAAGQ